MAPRERIDAVDVLRGVAVLGILAMNIYAFAMPFSAYTNPFVWGGSTGIDLATWVFTHVVFEQKFMTIFSMLFGAGLVLMTRRAEETGARFAGVYYKRLMWLAVFGLVHAYFLWFGDILFPYAVCGLLLYPLRRLSPRVLLVIGIPLVLLPLLTSTGMGLFLGFMRDTAVRAEAAIAAGETPGEFEQAMQEAWGDIQQDYSPSAEHVREQIDVYRGGYVGIFVDRAPRVLAMQTFMFAFFFFWRVSGLMLIGMALMKLDVLSARRPAGFYRTWVIVGYGIGLPLASYSAYALVSHRFDVIWISLIGGHWNAVGSLAVAAGHVGATMLLCRPGTLAGFRARLGAVGRMAFSNYLMHTLILTPVFYGYGLGLFGRFDRFSQMGFVVAVWALQIGLSSWWLGRFRYGPAEWLWRSLTYGRRQPMRILPKPM